LSATPCADTVQAGANASNDTAVADIANPFGTNIHVAWQAPQTVFSKWICAAHGPQLKTCMGVWVGQAS
jgi:hypothetical protein